MLSLYLIYVCLCLSLSLSLYTLYIYIHIFIHTCIWFSRNIGCFTRDIHNFMTCSCSATITTPSTIVAKGRLKKASCLARNATVL